MKNRCVAGCVTFAVVLFAALVSIDAPVVEALYSIGGMLNTMNVASQVNVALIDEGGVCWNQMQVPDGFTTWNSAPWGLACTNIINRVTWTPAGSSQECSYHAVNSHGPRTSDSVVVEAILVAENDQAAPCVYHEANAIGFNRTVFSRTNCGCGPASSRSEQKLKRSSRRRARSNWTTAGSGFTIINLLSVDVTLTAFAPSGSDNTTTPAPTPCFGPDVVPASNDASGNYPRGSGGCIGTPASTYQIQTTSTGGGQGSSGGDSSCTITVEDADGDSVFHAVSFVIARLGSSSSTSGSGALCVTTALARESPLINATSSCPVC